jgi:hypothetical protein
MFQLQSSDHHQGVNHHTCAITTYQRADDGQKTVTETCWVLIFNYASQTFLTCVVLNVNCECF